MARKKKGESESPKIKKQSLTDVLNAINKKIPIEYDKKAVSAYVISLFMAQDPQLIKIVNDINQYQFLLTDELIFKYYFNAVPKKQRFIKFTKKDESSKEREEEAKKISEEYGISKREAMLSL